MANLSGMVKKYDRDVYYAFGREISRIYEAIDRKRKQWETNEKLKKMYPLTYRFGA